MKIKRALISVYDKSGLTEFARQLTERGIEIVAAGGTQQFLRDEGVKATSIEKLTGQPLAVGGAVQTLNPQLQQAVLAGSTGTEHSSGNGHSMHGTGEFDLIVINIQPFERVSNRRELREDDVLEAIDIEGPALLRAAAKNFNNVAVVADPEVYPLVVEELDHNNGELGYDTRRLLASRAFDACAHYELAIASWFSEAEDFPTYLLRDYVKITDLPYGENPHQRAAYYAEIGARRHLLSMAEQLHGEDLTFNSLNDLNLGRRLISEFTIPGCAIIKHASPCGFAVSGSIADAFERALACDEPSAYGGVIVVNRPVDATLARGVCSRFFEVLHAPGYTDEALEILKNTKHMRVLVDRERRKRSPGERDMRRVIGGMLVQDTDMDVEEREYMEVVTNAQPTEKQWGDLLFGWRVSKWVSSNACVLTLDLAAIGIGRGNASRFDSLEYALKKAGQRAKGAMLASDAFFHLPDGPQLAIEAGIAGIIQPGGSNNDDEIIAMCDKVGIPMVFTHRRHFRH